MRKTRRPESFGSSGRVAAAALCLLWACGSSSNNSPVTSGTPTDGGGLFDTSVEDGSGDDGGSGDSAGDSTTSGDAGRDASHDSSMSTSTDATDDGTSSDSGLAADVPPPPSQCPTGHTWTAGSLEVTDQIARFGGLSATGLTAAWTRPSGDGVAADRGSMSGAFETLSFLLPALPSGVRPAIDSTGTMVFGVFFMGVYTQIWTRASMQSSWEAWSAATTPFDAIVSQVGQSGWTWSEPAFAVSGDRLFYVVTNGQPTIYESQWDTQTSEWAPGVQLPNPEFLGTDPSTRRRPTGASADDRTLFFYDEVSGVERAAWRDDPSQPFSYFEDIPAAPEAAPNADCSALYFIGGGPLPGVDAGMNPDGGTMIGPPPSDAGQTVDSGGDAGSVWNGSGTGVYVAQ
jgi:hypothetical protein